MNQESNTIPFGYQYFRTSGHLHDKKYHSEGNYTIISAQPSESGLEITLKNGVRLVELALDTAESKRLRAAYGITSQVPLSNLHHTSVKTVVQEGTITGFRTLLKRPVDVVRKLEDNL